MRNIFIILFITSLCYGYTPPIGIPAPPFGIDETVDMYVAPATYDFTDARGTAVYEISSITGKPYTHFVWKEHPSSTDSNNDYGTEAKPRKSIPLTALPAGSVVECHGEGTSGGTPYSNSWMAMRGSGTESAPVFIRGGTGMTYRLYGTGSTQEARVGGTYLIIENIDFDNAVLSVVSTYDSDHICIRNNEIHNGPEATPTSAIYAGGPRASSGGQEYIVVYNNDIHTNGNYQAAAENDYHGVQVSKLARYIWILENTMYHNGGDSVQVSSGVTPQPSADSCHHIYIGRNLMYDEGENAVDLKQCSDVIVSENTMHTFQGLIPSSDATAMVVNEDAPSDGAKDNIWIIFNKIYDSGGGIRCSGPSYVIGNVVWDTVSWGLRVTNTAADDCYVINNTFYNIGNGIRQDNVGAGDALYLYNNIIDIADAAGFSVEIENTTDSEMDYNLYDSSDNEAHIDWGSATDYTVAQLQANTAWGDNSLEGSPGFVDAANDDFDLDTGSQALSASLTTGTVKTIFDLFQSNYSIDIRVYDIDGETRDSNWDLGAYEKESGQGAAKYIFGWTQ
jgi:hypothetical protein